jgi:hypothetical protein
VELVCPGFLVAGPGTDRLADRGCRRDATATTRRVILSTPRYQDDEEFNSGTCFLLRIPRTCAGGPTRRPALRRRRRRRRRRTRSGGPRPHGYALASSFNSMFYYRLAQAKACQLGAFWYSRSHLIVTTHTPCRPHSGVGGVSSLYGMHQYCGNLAGASPRRRLSI